MADQPPPPAQTVPLRLLSAPVCPYAQRAVLTLHESGLLERGAAEVVDVSIAPGTKPPWFSALYRAAEGADESSDGKVPTLIHPSGIGSLAESVAVSDYLAALPEAGASGAALLPRTSSERARAALWMDGVVAKLPAAHYALLRAPADVRAAAAAALLAAVAAASAQLARAPEGGPFLLGAAPTLPDLFLYPFAERLVVVKHYRGFAVPDEPRFDAWRKWLAAMRARPSAVATAQSDEFFISAYAKYVAAD